MMIHFIKIIGLFLVLFTTVLSYGQRDYRKIPDLPKDSLETKKAKIPIAHLILT